MEKSSEQFKHIQRISRQTRCHHTHANYVYNQNLQKRLHHLANECQQKILRLTTHQKTEQDRQELVNITIQQITNEQQQASLRSNENSIEQEKIVRYPSENERRPSSSVQLPRHGISCRLFSHDCQLYPCQPIYQYTSFMAKIHDKTFRERRASKENSPKSSKQLHPTELHRAVQQKQSQQMNRQLLLAMKNQHHLVHRHVSMQRAVAKLDDESHRLMERLTKKNTFGYDRERQLKLSQDIQTHLRISAKFCT